MPPPQPIAPSIAKSARTYRVKNHLPPIKRNNVLMIEAQIQKAIQDKERRDETDDIIPEVSRKEMGVEDEVAGEDDEEVNFITFFTLRGSTDLY